MFGGKPACSEFRICGSCHGFGLSGTQLGLWCSVCCRSLTDQLAQSCPLSNCLSRHGEDFELAGLRGVVGGTVSQYVADADRHLGGGQGL